VFTLQVHLQILTGPERGRIIYLKSGQIARFGQTEWSDFAFPYDPQLDEVHFSLETTIDSVILIDLSRNQSTRIDGQQQTPCQLKAGQKIKAGSLVFIIRTEALFETGRSGPISISPQPLLPETPAEYAFQVCKTVEITDPARELMNDTIEILPFISLLSENQFFVDALRVLSIWFSKRRAVWWAADCIEMACTMQRESQFHLLSVARTWAQEPTEDNAYAASQAADAADSKLPANWLARAASWSGASLAPPRLPVVPPADSLSSQGIMAALLLAAVFTDPAKSTENYQSFITQGKQLSEMVLNWEET
jgi:hypothetical protein